MKGLDELIDLAYGKALKADDRKGGSVPVYGSNGQIGWPTQVWWLAQALLWEGKAIPASLLGRMENFSP